MYETFYVPRSKVKRLLSNNNSNNNNSMMDKYLNPKCLFTFVKSYVSWIFVAEIYTSFRQDKNNLSIGIMGNWLIAF